MGFYQRLLRGVSIPALLSRGNNDRGVAPQHRPARSRHEQDRLLRTPLVFETLEPRVLLSGDIIPMAGQTAILNGLANLATWTQHNLPQAAQLAQQLPVVSTSLGDLVDVSDAITNDLVNPANAYFKAQGANATIEGLATALQSSTAADTLTAIGSYSTAQAEFLIALSTFKTSAPITAALNVSSDSAGTNLQIANGPTLTGTASISMPLTFGFDNNASAFFVQPGSFTEGVTLSATNIATTAATTFALGVADATVTGGSASLAATATVTLKDPVGGDTSGYISGADFTSTIYNAGSASMTGTIPLDSILSATITGTGAVTLPITSTLVTGGSQTLKLTWGTTPGDPANDISAQGVSNIASLGTWATLDTISPALLQKAIAALPGLIQTAAGSTGFGASVPAVGTSLGTLFDFGTDFTGAATATANATSLDQVATALSTALGSSVTFTVNTANNELDMLVTATHAFTDVSVPYAIDTPVEGANFVLNGTMQASGTATATLNIALSFDTALMDTDRIGIVQTGSTFALSLTALAADPIVATAALGLIRVQVNDGSLTIGAESGNVVSTTSPATATIGFATSSGGRTTLTQINATPTTILAPVVYTGGIAANLPLYSESDAPGDTTPDATLGLVWTLGAATTDYNPSVTGATQTAALAVAPASLVTPYTLTAPVATGLQQLTTWSPAIAAAATQTTVFSTELPLLGADLSDLSKLSTILNEDERDQRLRHVRRRHGDVRHRDRRHACLVRHRESRLHADARYDAVVRR